MVLVATVASGNGSSAESRAEALRESALNFGTADPEAQGHACHDRRRSANHGHRLVSENFDAVRSVEYDISGVSGEVGTFFDSPAASTVVGRVHQRSLGGGAGVSIRCSGPPASWLVRRF